MNARRAIIILYLLAFSLFALSPMADAAIEPKSNFAKGTLIQGYAAGVTTIAVTTGQGPRFPSTYPYKVTWYDCSTYTSATDDATREIVQVNSKPTADSCVMLTDGIRQPNCRGFTSSASGTVKPSGKVTFR